MNGNDDIVETYHDLTLVLFLMELSHFYLEFYYILCGCLQKKTWLSPLFTTIQLNELKVLVGITFPSFIKATTVTLHTLPQVHSIGCWKHHYTQSRHTKPGLTVKIVCQMTVMSGRL